MSEEFLAFHSFPDEDTAKDFAEDLEKAGIDFRTESVRTILDSTFIGGSASPVFAVKLRPADFEKAHTALGDYYKKLAENVDKDYYLFGFTNEELFEIIAKPDEWGYFDNQLAQKILSDRGQQIDMATMIRLKENRITELAKPEKDDWGIISLGYLFLVLGVVFLFVQVGFAYTPYGFVVTLFIGTLLAYNKKVLPDGSKVFSYSANSRKQGKTIILAAVILLCISVLKWILFFSADS